MRDLLAPFRATLRALDRFEWMVDRSERSQSLGALRIRRSLAVVLLASGLILGAVNVMRGGTPGPGHAMMLMLALALYKNSSGRFIRDWAPVVSVVIVYGLAFHLAQTIEFPVTYTPQIQADKVIGFGTLPTVWLQAHLHLSVGIQAFCVLMYTTHFFFPLLLGFYIWFARRGEGFGELMYTDILLSVLAGVTYVLLPSAPGDGAAGWRLVHDRVHRRALRGGRGGRRRLRADRLVDRATHPRSQSAGRARRRRSRDRADGGADDRRSHGSARRSRPVHLTGLSRNPRFRRIDSTPNAAQDRAQDTLGATITLAQGFPSLRYECSRRPTHP
jgi:hypothetical protein